jgi:hypothetical protein
MKTTLQDYIMDSCKREAANKESGRHKWRVKNKEIHKIIKEKNCKWNNYQKH